MIFLLSGEGGPLNFSRFSKIRDKLLVSLMNSVDFLVKIFQGIQDFYQEKRTPEKKIFHSSKNEI